MIFKLFACTISLFDLSPKGLIFISEYKIRQVYNILLKNKKLLTFNINGFCKIPSTYISNSVW